MRKLLNPGQLVEINCRWAILVHSEKSLHDFEANPIAVFVKYMPRVKRHERDISEAHAIVLHEDKLVPVYCSYVKLYKGVEE